MVMVLQPPPIRGLSQTGGFELMIEDRSGKGVDALQNVVDRFQDEARKRPELAGVFSTFSARVPQLKFDVDRTKARRLDVPISDLFATLQANLGGYYVNDFDLYGKVWKVMVQAEGGVRTRPEDIQNLYVLNRKGERVPLSSLGEVRYALGPIDVPHYNLYAAAKMNGGPAPGYSSGQALAAMQEVAAEVLPEGFSTEWTGTTFQEQKTGNQAIYIFALSVVCVFLFMAALYESWIRPTVIILTVPLAMFGAVVGLWLYDMPLDVFGQIGLVMLIGLETKNAILIVEFGVEMRRERGMSILESAKAASRERLRPILMTSFAFVMGVLPMARATGAGAYSRNSLGIVIAFGIAVSTDPGPVRDPDLLRPGRTADRPLLPRPRRVEPAASPGRRPSSRASRADPRNDSGGRPLSSAEGLKAGTAGAKLGRWGRARPPHLHERGDAVLSSKLSVGIHILTIFALKPDEPLTSEFIAESVNTNPVVIRRLLGSLRAAGIVESKTGVGGGWSLLVDPERITLLDILRAVEPQDEIFALHRNEPNPECPCGLHIQSVLTEVYDEVQDGMTRQLAGITIACISGKIKALMEVSTLQG